MTLRDLLPDDWQAALKPRYNLSLLQRLDAFLAQERTAGAVFPSEENVFAALTATPYEQVKAVLLGQDPYHDDGQACGLAFSVPEGIPAPPSLRNILREYSADLGYPAPSQPSLLPWASHGVLLLNTVLTVRAHQAGSHRNHGWEQFTDAVIGALSARSRPVVFLLWGNPAREKLRLIDQERHLVLLGVHPSPLSAYRGFFGSRPFSHANELLQQKGLPPIDWRLP